MDMEPRAVQGTTHLQPWFVPVDEDTRCFLTTNLLYPDKHIFKADDLFQEHGKRACSSLWLDFDQPNI